MTGFLDNFTIEGIAEAAKPRGRGVGFKSDPRPLDDSAWSITKMTDLYQQIKRRLFLNMAPDAIASELGVDPQVVYKVRRSPIIQDQLNQMQACEDLGALNIQKQIEEMVPAALGVLREAIEYGTINGEAISSNMRLNQCNNIIDRTIGKPTQNINQKSVSVHLTSDDIAELKLRAETAINSFSS